MPVTEKITCWGCNRSNRTPSPKGKGLCKWCHDRKRKGKPLTLPIKAEEYRVITCNRSAEIQAEVDRRVAIYTERASRGIDLFAEGI